MKKTCDSCRFFDYIGENCCRYPPKVIRVNHEDVITVWPKVAALDDWCGEHQESDDDTE